MNKPHQENHSGFGQAVPTREDSYNFYSLALVLNIIITLCIGLVLHYTGCVPSNYFPFSKRGLASLLIVTGVCVLCLIARGITLPIIIPRKKFFTRKVSLDCLPQWLLELLILVPSVVSLFLLLQTSGGVTGPFGSYLGTFPIVIAVLASSRQFVIATFLLTLGVYISSLAVVPPVNPLQGHEIHYAIASFITFSSSLAFTAMLVMSEFEEAGAQKLEAEKTG
ncbi:MAG: hypothetical protein ACR2G4_09455 [Pyrinomonadaceae bacterium]